MKKFKSLILSTLCVVSLAGCGKQTFSVKFIADGTTISEKTYDFGTKTIEEPAVPEKTGYSGKWEDYVVKNENFDVNAIYTAITYTATFVVGDKTIKTISYTVETPASEAAPQVPAQDHKTGTWYPAVDLTKLENVTYTAKYDLDLFKANGDMDFVDGYYVATQPNSIGVEKDISLVNGTISANLVKAAGAEDDGIIFGVTYLDGEKAFWEDNADYYFFFVSQNNDAYLAKVATVGEGRWNQLSIIAITKFNEETPGGYPLAVSIENGLIRCFVGDDCLIKYYDSALLAGSKVGYRMAGQGAKISPIVYSAEVRKDANSIGDYSICNGSAEMDGDFIKTTSGNSLFLDNTMTIEENKLYTTRYKSSVKQDAGIVIGYSGGSRTFWEAASSYYIHLVNFDGILICAEIDNGIWNTRADNNNIKDYKPSDEIKLSFSVTGTTLKLYVNYVMVHQYEVNRNLVGTALGFRAASVGGEFTPFVKEEINHSDSWYIRSGRYSYNVEKDELTSNCDGSLAWYMDKQLTPGHGGTVSCDVYYGGSTDDNAHTVAGLRIGCNNPSAFRWSEDFSYDFYVDWAANLTFCTCNNTPIGWNPDYVAFSRSVRGQSWFKINDYNKLEVTWDGNRSIILKVNGETLFEGEFKEPIAVDEGLYCGVFNQFPAGGAKFKNFTLVPGSAN